MKYTDTKFSLLLSLFLSFSSGLQLCAIDIKVATFNIRRAGSEEKEDRLWEKRKEKVLATIKKLDADVIGLQEVTEQQLTYLKTNLVDYGCVGEGRGTAFFGTVKSEWTPIFYKENIFEPNYNTTFGLNGPGGRVFWNEKSKGKLPRICTLATLKHKQTLRLFNIFNTHLDNEYPLARLNQATTILNFVAQKPQLPTIIMGDFNAEWLPDISKIKNDVQQKKEILKDCNGNEVTLATKFGNAGFKNTRKSTMNNETMSDEWKLNPTGLKAFLKKWFSGKKDSRHATPKTIDHILANESITAKSHEHVYIDLDTVSDHRPVIATLQF